jgi:hypothetical protein
MKRLLPALLLLPLCATATEKLPSGEPVPAMALVQRDGAWQLLPTELQSYVDELGALAEIRSSVADAQLNLADTRLRAGAIPSALPLGAETTCYNDPYEPKVFQQTLLQAGDYRLDCHGNKEGRYNLLLSSAGRSQMLPGNDPANGSWQLLWAGDLDRDGKPDLIGQFSVEGGYCMQVMLSADAGPEQLLAPGELDCLSD